METLASAATLAWLLVVPLCPDSLAHLLPGGGAAGFMCLLMLGCTVRCLTELLLPHSAHRSNLFALGLPCGVALAVCIQGADLPHPTAWACAGGLMAGIGLGQAMMGWGARNAGLPLRRVARECSLAGLVAVLIGVLLHACIDVEPALWALFGACSVLAALEGFVPGIPARRHHDGSGTVGDTARGTNYAALQAKTQAMTRLETKPTDAAAAPRAEHVTPAQVSFLLSRLWEPAAGLGLSFLSALLPWGSLLSGEAASMPVFWSFALGIALLCAAIYLFAGHYRGHLDPDIATHIIVPVLAASVVGLRMLGDLDQIGVELTALKGVGSGVASAGFLLFALLAMTRMGAGAPRPAEPLALGLGLACLIGSLTLPLHMAHQQFASLVAPFLSLVFLVASCCSSVVHIRKHVSTHEPERLSVEAATERVAEKGGLSPRERQVLHHLVLGRSAEAIGAKLGISPNTVRSHIVNIHTKLSISSRDDLADLIEETMNVSDIKQPDK